MMGSHWEAIGKPFDVFNLQNFAEFADAACSESVLRLRCSQRWPRLG